MDGINDNRGYRSPVPAHKDMEYVENYLQEALAHFSSCGIVPWIVADGLTQAIIKVAPGEPFEKLPDEGDLQNGLSCLVPSEGYLSRRVAFYYKAKDRLHRHRIEQLAARHNCSVEEAFEIWVASKEQSDPTILKTGLPATAPDDKAGV